MTEIIGKHLIAERCPPRPGRKTCWWYIHARSNGDILGTVTWFPGWRQYTFNPSGEATFNAECLRDIAGFLQRVRAVREDKTVEVSDGG